MKKIIYLALAVVFLQSCDRTEAPFYDVDGGQALAAFNITAQTLPVADTGGTAEILVGVTTKSNVDRAVNITIDPSSTAAAAEYTIDPASLVVPAGEFVARVKLNGNFNEIPVTGLTQVVLNLEGVEGAILDNETTGRLQHAVNLFRFCPFENGSTFLGDYQITTEVVGIFGVSTFDESVVTLTQGSTVADRKFGAVLYPAFGGFGPYVFNISLICGEVVVSGNVRTGVGCSGELVVGAPITASTYDGGDDSEFRINFTDDVEDGCTGNTQVTILLTKI
jgi:hypothetical protein